DAIGFRTDIAATMLDEIEALLLPKCRSEIGSLADQTRPTLFANPAFEHRLDKDELVPVDQGLNLTLRCSRSKNLSHREIDILEELCSVVHSCDLHGDVAFNNVVGDEWIETLLNAVGFFWRHTRSRWLAGREPWRGT